MTLFYYGFKWKVNNWRHPFVINNKGTNKLSFSNIRLSQSPNNYINSGWHFSYCFKIADIIRKLESFAHTEYNTDKYKDKDYILRCINNGVSIFNENENFTEAIESELPEGYKYFEEKLNSLI
jgi:beta-1,4-mannosyl-glycoprotein beta-1,4-N-acetylglucosaminyltransferase